MWGAKLQEMIIFIIYIKDYLGKIVPGWTITEELPRVDPLPSTCPQSMFLGHKDNGSGEFGTAL